MEQVYQSLCRLIAIDTATKTQSNDIIRELRDLFDYSESYVELNQDNEIKALLFGINCELHDVSDAVIFSGHIDTVDSQAKRIAKTRKNNVYGLGAADMKSFFSCIDYCLKKGLIIKHLVTPLIVAITLDEETDNRGVCLIVNYLDTYKIKANRCIVGEPTNVGVASKCRGCFDFILTVYGCNAHITDSTVINPVELCAKLSLLLKSEQKEETSISVCFFDSEKTFNVIPRKCSLGFEIRTYDCLAIEEIIRKLQFVIGKNVNYELERMGNYLLPFKNLNSKLGELICCYNGNRRCEFGASSEAGFYSSIGIDTIIFGPGDLSFAHSANEHISMVKMKKYIGIINQFIEGLS